MGDPGGPATPETCAACGFPGLTEPARDTNGNPSYEICPSCGFEPGYDDDDQGHSHDSWRRRWIAAGMVWWSSRRHPAGWDPAAQLAAAGLLDPEDGLEDRLLQLVDHVVAGLPVAAVVRQHAAAARVLTRTSTVVDVEAPPHLPPIPQPDGPLPVDAHVHRDGQLVGEVLVWVRDGRLSGLEQPWFTDAPPEQWPDPTDVTVTPRACR